MDSKKQESSSKQPPKELIAPLFPEMESDTKHKTRKYKRYDQAIWTENKAHFIQQYLKYFVQVTKHGAYIDGFAGPQSRENLGAWTAALVLGSEPKWLRKFFLCEINRQGVRELRKLVASQVQVRDKKGRKITRVMKVYPGDFNKTVDRVLAERPITQKEATFCLLDQRTFECHWATLQKLARYKERPNHKIELLYFLGVGWLHRAFSGLRSFDKPRRWWGSDEWPKLKTKTPYAIAELVRQRFHDELGYAYVAAYPVFDRHEGGRVMYYMIHASDHDEAPALMVRAHYKAVRARPSAIQTDLGF